jgi:hypothetical protein
LYQPVVNSPVAIWVANPGNKRETTLMFEQESRTAERWPSFKIFDDCSPGELMRMRVSDEDGTEWVLKGRFDESPPLLPVFVFAQREHSDSILF